MTLAPGARLGPYEISAPLGAGGMGEVYRARDTKLQREVAVKILPAAFEHDADRLDRFMREAQALAALNHPHIAQVYGVQEFDREPRSGTTGAHAIIMELVEGPTLADRLAGGPLPVAEAVALARQIADALDAAHERNIVHRDLKPANIKLTADGAVKVLDFGLAKLGAAAPGSASGADATRATGADLMNSPTMVSPAVTHQGVVLGTAAYMSPEQARGRPVDKRADIWAFGVVCFEMLTGRTLFAGDTVSDTIAEVLEREIDLSALPPGTPAAVRRVIERCLERDPRKRLRDVADAIPDLELAGNLPAPAVAPVTRGVPYVLVAALVLIAAGVAAFVTRNVVQVTPVPPTVARAVYTMPGGALRRTIQRPHLAISPDGRYVAALAAGTAGTTAVAIRRVDRLDWTTLPGTDNASGVIFSPDSQWIGFWTSRELRKVRVSGGVAQTIHTLDQAQTNGPAGVTWADDDTLYFADQQMRIAAVPAAGGPARIVVDRPFVLQPHAVPGGRALLYVQASAGSMVTTVMLHSLDGGEDVALTEGQSPMYLRDGRLLVLRGNALVAMPVDLKARRVTDDPVVVLEDVASLGGAAQYGVSDQGTLIYVPAAIASESLAALHRVSRDGAATEVDGVTREYSDPRLSPDGKRLALHLSDQQNDVWVKDLERGALARMSFGLLEDETPVWSPDAEWLAHSGWCGATDDARCVFRRRVNGRSEPEVLWKTDAHTHLTDWSPDGRTIVMEVVHPERRSDLLLLDVQGGAPTEFLATTFNEQAARISPDGRWIAYQSNESGEMEVYLQSFPDGGRQVQVSSGGGVQPVWLRDGGELYYRSATHLMAARVSSGALPAVGQPARLFRDTYLRPQATITRGTTCFLMARSCSSTC